MEEQRKKLLEQLKVLPTIINIIFFLHFRCMYFVLQDELGLTEAPSTLDPLARPRRSVDNGLFLMTTPTPEAIISVKWHLSDIDYPICLNYFQLVYYDILCNETKHQVTVRR